MLGYLDESVDPCEDFVRFSTNGWVKANPLPKSKPIWGSFNQVRANNQVCFRFPSSRSLPGAEKKKLTRVVSFLISFLQKVILEILKKPIEVKSAEELKKETPQEIAERDNLIKMSTVFKSCLDEVRIFLPLFP